ncbi:MAG: type I restriction enzyme HsdR N-terminal domain-containing protein [Bacteroidetes bacterium]|nr:MAG: type I restriction enzyme HsdR N-terminal domain-containing protein [Bacteroidota bacterium]
MRPLNLPPCDVHLQRVGETRMIFDPLRKKYVKLTPEEWVRQHFIQFLIRERGVPRALIAVEMAFTYQRMRRRADVVVHDRQGRPLVLVECKAPEVEITQAAFDQVARYNKVVQAPYLVVTNGLVHYCCALDHEAHTYRFLDDLPPYDAL